MTNARARELRNNATDAERVLWRALKQLDLPDTHFRRQVPIRGYVADFACHKAKLVVEIDGGQHGVDANVARDLNRTAALEADGYTVIRFWNYEVLQSLDVVMETIWVRTRELLAVTTPTPNPSPQRGGE